MNPSQGLTEPSAAKGATGAAAPTSAPPAKNKRIISCISCQQRKVKCDRHVKHSVNRTMPS